MADTHSLAWYFTKSRKLGREALQVFRDSTSGEDIIIVPTVVLAEIMDISEKKRIKVDYEEILKEYNHFFKDMIKSVVDLEREIIALDGELHADLEALLIEKGSKQEDLWGINLYLEKPLKERIEYTALINIRPSQDNSSMEVEKIQIRKKIGELVNKLIILCIN